AVPTAADLTSGGPSLRPDPEFAKKESATAVDAAAAGAARSGPRARERAQSRVTRPLFLEPPRGASELERPLAVLRFGPSCRRRPRTSARPAPSPSPPTSPAAAPAFAP